MRLSFLEAKIWRFLWCHFAGYSLYLCVHPSSPSPSSGLCLLWGPIPNCMAQIHTKLSKSKQNGPNLARTPEFWSPFHHFSPVHLDSGFQYPDSGFLNPHPSLKDPDLDLWDPDSVLQDSGSGLKGANPGL